MTARAALARVAIAACTLAASREVAAQAPPSAQQVPIVASLPSTEARQTVLAGASGQLYRPSAEQWRWRRHAVGGVAATVRGVIEANGAVYAVGARSPIYRWRNGTWHALPLANRGTTVAGGANSVPVLAVGRHVYLMRARRWTRATSSIRDISAIWAESARRVYVADSSGDVRLWNGASWSNVRLGLAAGDIVVQLAGEGRSLFARSRAGALVQVRGTTARTLAAPPDLGAFSPLVVAPDHAGEAWVVGLATTPAGEQRPVLARTQAGALTNATELPVPAQGDRFAVLRAFPDGSLLLVTRRGAVHVRSADGSWSTGQVSGELPPGAIRAFEAAPARSR